MHGSVSVLLLEAGLVLISNPTLGKPGPWAFLQHHSNWILLDDFREVHLSGLSFSGSVPQLWTKWSSSKMPSFSTLSTWRALWIFSWSRCLYLMAALTLKNVWVPCMYLFCDWIEEALYSKECPTFPFCWESAQFLTSVRPEQPCCPMFCGDAPGFMCLHDWGQSAAYAFVSWCWCQHCPLTLAYT